MNIEIFSIATDVVDITPTGEDWYQYLTTYYRVNASITFANGTSIASADFVIPASYVRECDANDMNAVIERILMEGVSASV